VFRNPDAVVYVDTAVIRVADVRRIDISEIEKQRVKVLLEDDKWYDVTGFAALEFVWQLAPAALEGKRLKWPKNAWAVHNLFAHPLMQLLAFIGCYGAAMNVHDSTIPKPIPNDRIQNS
jgi:hypothetical protein